MCIADADKACPSGVRLFRVIGTWWDIVNFIAEMHDSGARRRSYRVRLDRFLFGAFETRDDAFGTLTVLGNELGEDCVHDFVPVCVWNRKKGAVRPLRRVRGRDGVW